MMLQPNLEALRSEVRRSRSRTMRRSGVVSSLLLVGVVVGLLVVGGVGHNDEVSYVAEADGGVESALSILVQNTGGVRRYFGLVGLRRYGPPFELYVDLEVPQGTESVTLRELEVLDGDRRVVSISELTLPVEIARVYQVGESHSVEEASYFHPGRLALTSEVVTVTGSAGYEVDGHTEWIDFEQRFTRVYERGFFTGL